MNKELSENQEAIKKTLKMFALIGAVLKSMFEAFVQIVWGLASVMFLNVLLLYLHINELLDEIPAQFIDNIYVIFQFILEYWGLLFIFLSLFYLYVNWKEVNK